MDIQLTPEQETAVAEELGNVMHFEGDDVAIELGIPSRIERDWTDEEIDRIWAAIEERYRDGVIANLLSAAA